MKWKFEEEFRLDKPETIGETDRHFDLDNYKDWLEYQLAEARKQLSLFAVSNNEVAVAFGDWLRTQRADIFYGYPTTKKLFEMYKKATDC
jgi:hypothetical protein